MKDQPEEKTIFDTVKEYLKLRKELALLTFIDKASSSMASLVTVLVISLFAVFSLLFLSIAAGFLVAEKTGSFYVAFLSVAGFYILVILLIIFIRKTVIEKPLINFMIKQFLRERNKLYEKEN